MSRWYSEGAAREGRPREREAGQEADEGRGQEQSLGEEGQTVLHEHGARRALHRRQEQREQPQDEDAEGGEPSDEPSILAAGEQAGDEDDEQDDPEPALEREGRADHGPTILRSRGTVAVSTGPRAMPGISPKTTMTATRMPMATHSGPRASSRWWKCGDGGPQKICLVARRT